MKSVGFWLVVVLTGCGDRADPNNIRVFSREAVLLELPFSQQTTPNLCGLAAAEMLTRFHRVPLTDKAAEILRTRADAAGASGRDLKQALENSGYDVIVFKGSFSDDAADLRRFLDAGRPLIVMVGEEAARHYCLVTGYDDPGGLLAILDPLKGPRAVETGDFCARWAAANYFTLLALPKPHE